MIIAASHNHFVRNPQGLSTVRNLHLYRTEAVVLKRSDFGEADRLVTLFTPNLGKLRVIAKGIRRPVSKMAGHLELFTHSQLLLAKGRNLDLITQSETLESFLAMREDLMRTTLAHYVAELTERLTPEHLEDYPLYRLLVDTLRRLDADKQPEIAVRYFEVQLLDHLGYRPQLQHCVQCRQGLTPVPNYLAARLGGALCPTCGKIEQTSRSLTVNALKVLRLLQNGNYATAVQLRLDDDLERELEAHTRALLYHVLERDVNSVGFLNRLRAEGVTNH
ncbi:MAG: DNA repair protein RecO [Chloroflexota bacterium]